MQQINNLHNKQQKQVKLCVCVTKYKYVCTYYIYIHMYMHNTPPMLSLFGVWMLIELFLRVLLAYTVSYKYYMSENLCMFICTKYQKHENCVNCSNLALWVKIMPQHGQTYIAKIFMLLFWLIFFKDFFVLWHRRFKKKLHFNENFVRFWSANIRILIK